MAGDLIELEVELRALKETVKSISKRLSLFEVRISELAKYVAKDASGSLSRLAPAKRSGERAKDPW